MPSPPSPNLSQFNLRTLFVGVALMAMVFAAASYGGWAGLLAAATLAALVSAHVIGNVLGRRLRDEVSPQLNPTPPKPPRPWVRGRLLRGERRLHQRTPLGRIIHVTSAGAAVMGGLLGGLALAFWTDASLSGWMVGMLSSAVLGGFFGFLLACFLEMTIRALWQASEGERETPREGDGEIRREMGR
ncbi:MAG: hypothetical protein WD894_05445 [Pirellulales bacterium]